MCAMGTKWSIFPDQKLFGTNHCYYFHLPMGPFHCAKLKKILTADPKFWRFNLFGPKFVHLPQTSFSFLKIITIILIYLLAFHCAKFIKNSSNGSTVMRMFNFSVQNCPFPQMRIFPWNLLMSLVSFILAYLHAKNKSQILIY